MDINRNGMTEKQRLAELNRLKASYAMYEKAKTESIDKRKNMTDKFGNKKYNDNSIDSTIEIMTNMQNDIIQQYILLGGEKEDLENCEYTTYAESSEETTSEDVEIFEEKATDNINIGKGVMEYLSTLGNDTKNNEPTNTFNNVDSFDMTKIKEQFDLIPLPSKGEPYANKLSKIPVAYLTAYDENIIVSPNLYKDGSFLDYILKAKILNPAIDAGNLLPGDRDAIILWLRATGYGNEFPVAVTDDETGREFNTNIDLAKIQYRDFNLKSDENGWFTYTLPVSGDEIKFNFLTYKEQSELLEREKSENVGLKREEIKNIAEKLAHYKNNELSETVGKHLGKRIDDVVKTLNEWYDNINVENKFGITHTLTNRMFKMIKSINGITDPKFIKEYIAKMNLKDASSFRRYTVENEPGLDFNVEVERPESLGGGSMKTFLSLDQYIFLNIA